MSTVLQQAGGIVQGYLVPPTMGVTELPVASGGTANGMRYVPPNLQADGLVSFESLRVALRRNMWTGVALGAVGSILAGQIIWAVLNPRAARASRKIHGF